MFACDFGVNDQIFGVIIQRFSRMLEFTVVEPLAVDEFPYFCDELAGPFESCFSASYVSEICLLCTCEGFRNET